MIPILFNLGPINIYSFGLFLALALVFSSFLIWREGRQEFEDEVILDVIFFAILGAIIGSRFLYILLHFENFNFNIFRWIHPFLYPGFSLWGGIIGGLLFTAASSHRKRISFWRIADFLSLGAIMAQIFGQIGCFLNGCAVGKVTTLPWGMTVLGFAEKRHPLALYGFLTSIIIFAVLLKVHHWAFAQKRKREGIVVLTYFLLLSFFSLTLEFLQEGGVYFYGLKAEQGIALVFFLGALGFLSRHLRNLR